MMIKLSPIPKIKRPKERIETLGIERSQRCEALQGVIGMVL
jgi:hypothetical protein